MDKAKLFTTIAVTVAGIVDLWFVTIKGTGTSISNFLVGVGFKDPVIVFAFGFLGGHLFGNMRLDTSNE